MMNNSAIPLNVTQQARHRLIVGLQWDVRFKTPRQHPLTPENETEKDRENRAYRHTLPETKDEIARVFDLDLTCLVFNGDGILIDAVSPHPDEQIDASGHIYHSGDDRDGIGDHDDEAVSIELKDLPQDICHLFFLITVQSGETFADIPWVLLRVADGFHDTPFYSYPLTTKASPEEQQKTALLSCHIYKDPQKIWRCRPLNVFYVDHDVLDWPEEAAKYLDILQGRDP